MERRKKSYERLPFGRPPKQSDEPFNPFINHSTPMDAPWEIFKYVVMFPVFVLRVLLMAACFFFGWAWSSLALIGAKNIYTKPHPKWRRNLLWPISWGARGVLFACGYHWIEVIGKPAPRSKAPIIVCNHVTFVDPVYMFVAHLPMIVTAKENLNIFVAGTVMKALQVVTVDRANPNSRRDASGEIKRRAMCNDWAPVNLFPEATTTNGRSMVSFKTGAFMPGLPVQPVVITYPYTSFDPAWVAEGLPDMQLLFRMMSQPHNRMRVEYLPPVYPTPEEQCDARLYAERVRLLMAARLNLSLSDHSFGDVLLALEARKMRMPKGAATVGYGMFERLFRLDVREAKGFLRRFNTMNVDKGGTVCYEGFLSALALPDGSAARSVFEMLDTSDRGRINFKEFLAGLVFVARHACFPESVAATFCQLDSDGDGKLSEAEAREGLRRNFPTITDEQLSQVCSLLGLDSKSHLSGEEFEQFLKTHPEYLLAVMAAQVEGKEEEDVQVKNE